MSIDARVDLACDRCAASVSDITGMKFTTPSGNVDIDAVIADVGWTYDDYAREVLCPAHVEASPDPGPDRTGPDRTGRRHPRRRLAHPEGDARRRPRG